MEQNVPQPSKMFRLGVVAQGEALHLEVPGHGEEGVELLLCHVHLAVVHEVEDGDQVGVLDALQVEEGVLVPVAPQHRAEEGGAGREDDLVCLQLLIIAGQGDVEEIFVFTELPKGTTSGEGLRKLFLTLNIVLYIIPSSRICSSFKM